jgi:trehalose 6-phosphate phosphatase
VFLDFDGTLAEIVARPELARLVPAAGDVLSRLAGRVEVMAVISGRPPAQLAGLVPVPGVRLVGLYGLVDDGAGWGRVMAARPEIEEAAAGIEGAWVEDKGASLAVHYRATPDPGQAETVLIPALEEIAARNAMSLFRGKMVVEVAAGEVPGKGAVVRGLVREGSLDGCLYAGDDLPDLDAFAVLDELREAGLTTVKVAVGTEETPEELTGAADVVVEHPAGLLALLSEL